MVKASGDFEGEFELGGQEHFYLETHAAWAERGRGRFNVVTSSTQHPSEVQTVVAHVLHLPINKVVVQSPRMGGGFGGKETQANTPAALAAFAAIKTGQAGARAVQSRSGHDVDRPSASVSGAVSRLDLMRKGCCWRSRRSFIRMAVGRWIFRRR